MRLMCQTEVHINEISALGMMNQEDYKFMICQGHKVSCSMKKLKVNNKIKLNCAMYNGCLCYSA